jgi:hypothetical protein
MSASSADTPVIPAARQYVSLYSPTYLLFAYDLSHASSHRYREVTKILSRLGDAVRATQSHWLIATLHPPAEVAQAFSAVIRPGDRYLLNHFTGCYELLGLNDDALAWLARHGFYHDVGAFRRAA